MYWNSLFFAPGQSRALPWPYARRTARATVAGAIRRASRELSTALSRAWVPHAHAHTHRTHMHPYYTKGQIARCMWATLVTYLLRTCRPWVNSQSPPATCPQAPAERCNCALRCCIHAGARVQHIASKAGHKHKATARRRAVTLAGPVPGPSHHLFREELSGEYVWSGDIDVQHELQLGC